jgi:hypothetical protein
MASLFPSTTLAMDGFSFVRGNLAHIKHGSGLGYCFCGAQQVICFYGRFGNIGYFLSFFRLVTLLAKYRVHL